MRFDSSSSAVRIRRRRRFRLLVVLVVLVGLGLLAAAAFRQGPPPTISVVPEPKVIGRSTDLEVQVAEPSRGLSHVRIELEQDGTATTLAEKGFAALPGWKLFGARTPVWNFPIQIGKQHQASLREGEATLRVVADRAPAWLRRGAPALWERSISVRLTPPTLEVSSTQHNVEQGGSEAVVYRVGASSVRDGVEVGDWFFPGWPLPGGDPEDRFALFAVPYNVADVSQVRLVTYDEAGNLRSAGFVDHFVARPPHPDDVQIDDRFLERVVPSIMAGAPDLQDKGNLLDNFLEINRKLRQENRATLRALAGKTAHEFLWRAPFLALPGGQVMSSFADHRTYFYQGREVDQQDHLGYDLASVAHAPVPAANSGRVVLARELGIFGNAVVIDHGYGLMSLYAHLSEIAVHEGEEVRRAQVLGTSGATGLAGGDHLHFSFLLDGLPVRPIEWWDPHWIGDHIGRKLGDALPFGRKERSSN